MTEKPSVPEMTPEIADNIKKSLLFLYADQIGVKVEDLDISIVKKLEPA